MDVKPIDRRTQFTGYVDKSVVKYINKCVKNNCYYLAHSAAIGDTTVKAEEIIKVKQFGNKMLEKLSKFMSGLHEKSVMKYRRMSEEMVSDIYLENPVTDRLITLASTDRATKYSLTMHLRPRDNLEILSNMADRLLARDSKAFNTDFLTHGESELDNLLRENTRIQRFLAKRKAKKLDKYAAEIGEGKTSHKAETVKSYSDEIALVKKRIALFKKSRSMINKIISDKS